MNKKFLILFIVLFFSCELLDNSYYGKLRDPLENYELFWKELNDYYGLIDFKSERHLNSRFGGWEGLYNDHKKYISGDISERKLFAVLSSVLYNLHDAHSYWLSDRAPSFYYETPVTGDYPHPAGISWGGEEEIVLASDSFGYSANFPDLRIPKEYLYNSKYYEEDILYAGLIDISKVENNSPIPALSLDRGKVYGYVNILSFIKYDDLKNFNAEQNWSRKIDSVLYDLRNTDGLIIDIRHNAGGFEGNLEAVLSRFVQKTKMTYISFVRNSKYKNSYDRVEYYIGPQGNVYSKKIVLLTDRKTSSCGDLFTLGIRSEDNVVVVGQNTHGILSKVIARELPIGWSFRMSSGFTLDPDGYNYEEVGIPPDIVVSKDTVATLYSSYNFPSIQFYYYDPLFCKGVEVLNYLVSENRSVEYIRDNL